MTAAAGYLVLLILLIESHYDPMIAFPSWEQLAVTGIVLTAGCHLIWRARKYVVASPNKEVGCATGCSGCSHRPEAKVSLVQLGGPARPDSR